MYFINSAFWYATGLNRAITCGLKGLVRHSAIANSSSFLSGVLGSAIRYSRVSMR